MAERVKFIISDYNSKFNPTTKTWSIDLPNFYTDNTSSDRMIQIETFIYFKPNGTSDLGTCFHCADLYDGEYSQLNYLIGLSGTTIGGNYIINSRKRTLEFWFTDYTDLNQKCLNTETLENEYGEYEQKPVHFFIQCNLIY